jgi:hypothetical protein
VWWYCTPQEQGKEIIMTSGPVEPGRSLTEKQQALLDALYGEAKGNFRLAMDIAGYSKTVSQSKVMKAIKAEIIALGENVLAANSPKAVMSMVGIIDDPTALGNRDKLAAAKEILDRAGLIRTDKVEHSVTAPSIVILPPLAEEPTENS